MPTTDEIQQWLIQKIANLSGLPADKIDAKKPFINYGMESIEMIGVTGDLESWLGCRLSPNLLYDYTTIEQLANHLSTLSPEKKEKKTETSHKKLFPLSYRQEWLYLNQKNYLNIMFAIKVQEALDIASFEWAIEQIIRRHDNLRTSFVMHEQQPSQFISSITKVDIPVIKIKSEKLIPAIAAKMLNDPIDFSKPPLFRVSILEKNANDYVILLIFHHLIFDGFSLLIFIQELQQLYHHRKLGNKISLPTLEFQYADYIDWQRKNLQGRKLEQHLSYWRAKLANVPGTFENKNLLTGPVMSYNFTLMEDEKYLLEFSSKYRTSPFLVLYACFALLVHFYTKLNEIIISVVDANRFQTMTKNLIGYFSNHIFLRTTFEGEQPFIDLLEKVKHEFIESCNHGDIPFGKMNLAGKDKNTSTNDEDLAVKHGRVLFNFIKTPEEFAHPLNTHSTFLHGEDFPTETWENIESKAKTDPKNFRYLYMRVISEQSKLYGRIIYAKQLFDNEEMKRFVQLYEKCIHMALLDPTLSIKKLLE